MKKGFKYISIIFVIVLITNIRCSDYLLEDNKTGTTEDVIYSTKSGLDGLLAASYSYLRCWYGKVAAYDFTEGGTDTWLGAYDSPKVLLDYTGISPDTPPVSMDEYWELFFAAINTCNTGIENVAKASTFILSEANKDAYIGEFKALRAFYYWHLVEIWGPVQINRDPIREVLTVARRDSEEDVYAFILEDIDDAITRLAGKTTKTGHINLWAAKALKARFLIYKASKFNDMQAYADAAAVSEEVITGSGLFFFNNCAECWNAQNENGISNKEVIWWVEYSDILENNILPKRLKMDENGDQLDWARAIRRTGNNNTGGNASHLLFVGVWNMVPGLTTILIRTDTEAKKILKYKGVSYDIGTSYQAYSKGFTHFCPTGYLLDLFNDATDQRYQAYFRDVYYVAPALTTAFEAGIAPPTGYANMRDTAIYLSKTPVTPAQISGAANRYVLFSRTDVGNPGVYPLYQDAAGTLPTIATGTAGNDNFKGNRMFIQLRKFDDLNGSIIRDVGDRDAFVLRLSEMYLIASEGYMMAGQPAQAIARLNDLRTARAASGQSNVLSASEEVQVTNKDINVILDERARELCGEQQRWFDLKRTGKLVERVKLYNGFGKNNIQDYHTLRPIPTTQLNAITNKTDGPDPDGFWQNPGY
jgi:hypothetical protein